MSRSFKKVAGYVDRNPFMKRYSNKSLRKASRNSLQSLSDPDQYDDMVSSFSCFKRCSVNPYDICDWRFLYFSEQELMSSCVYQSSPNFDYISLFTTNVEESYKDYVDKKSIKVYYKALTK